MVKYSDDDLDTVFAALSDRTRRHVLQSLAGGEPPGHRARRAARDVAARLHEAPAGARGRRPDRALQGGRVVSCELVRAADEGRLHLDVALREVLDREARFARPLPVPARGVADMEQARLAEKPSLSLQRHYPVAPEKVWRAWTDPQALKRWWGPGGPEPVSVARARRARRRALPHRVRRRRRARTTRCRASTRKWCRTASSSSPGPGRAPRPSASRW